MALPGGTVTFLFTDIEGSTRLLQELGDGYGQVVADHRRLLREVFRAAGGSEVDTQGDAFFYSFARARDAVAGAVDAQRALAQHDWPDGTDVRVRMGLHTGEPTVGDLASALGVTARTVDRDIAALRAAGESLATRGSTG